MSAIGNTGDGICILSFDSGGPGTYSQLLIMKEYMSRLASDTGVLEDDVYPADYFDLMGGVGFGGLVALVLGHFRMNVKDAIDILLDVASAIFPEDSRRALDLNSNTIKLKEAIESVIQGREAPLETKMNDPDRPPAKCKVALYAATSARINHPQVFRTYPSRGSSLNPTIVDAICATMSIPSHFLPVKIGPRMRQQSFIGGALGVNNPTRELLKEASIIFGKDRRVTQIMSIGSGLPRVLSLNSSKEAGFGLLVTELAADCGAVAQELHTKLYNIPAYLRLNVDRGLEDVVMDDWNELGDIESHTGAYIAVASVSESLDTSLRRLSGRVGTVTLGQLNQSSSIKLLAKSVPAVSSHFIARTKPCTFIVHHLVASTSSHQRVFLITGMGGCGKTQVVSHFLREYPSLYAKVIFVNASSSASIQSDLQAWAQAAGDGHERDMWEGAIRILMNAPLDERWLLILDNADDPTLNLVPFIPKIPNLTIIITSRNRDLSDLSTTYHLELGEMEENEALATLLHAARRQGLLSSEELKSAMTLVKELGYLAAALVQAGTYCHQLSSEVNGIFQPYTFTQYLLLFYSHRADLMKKAAPPSLDNYQRGVYTALDLSYEIIPQSSRELLHFLSFFHHTDIPLEALAAAARKGFVDSETCLERPESHSQMVSELSGLLCVGGAWNELHVQDMMRTLRSFSLISATSVNDCTFIQLHPLIQAWSRDMVSSVSQRYQAMAIQILTSWSGGGDEPSVQRYVLPHVLEILGQLEVQDLHINDLLAIGKTLRAHGQYQKGSGVIEAALEKMKGCTDVDREKTLVIAAHLAACYRSEGRWNEAEKLYVNILEQRRRIEGMDHLNAINAARNLASTYRHQGRYNEAEKLDVEILAQRRRIQGMEHLDTIDATGRLASTYFHQGRYKEAEKLYVNILEQRRRIEGVDHLNTINAAHNLASTYYHQGRYNEAEKLRAEVLEQRRKTQGMAHSDTTKAAENLAATHSRQGRHSEAQTLRLEVLEQRGTTQGMGHLDTIEAAENLASTYWHQGRYSEAEKLQVGVLEQRMRTQGTKHLDTISAAANLASTCYNQGRYNEAEKLYVEILEQRRMIQGMEHLHTINAAQNLASTYYNQGQYNETEKLLVEFLEQRRRIQGMEHLDTINAAHNLASTYYHQGRYNEAEKLQLEVLERRRKIQGVEHLDTINAAGRLALTYCRQGRDEGAEKLYVEILKQRRRIQGMEHLDTISASENLALTYWHQGRYTEAEKLQVGVLEQRRRTRGMEHLDTISAAKNLAWTYYHQGWYNEAEKLLVEVLEQRRKIQGMEHLDTIDAAKNLARTYYRQGRYNEVEKLEVEILEQRRRIQGMEHLDTITAARDLARTCEKQNHYSEAIGLLAPAVKLSLKVSGQQDPSTQRRINDLVRLYEKMGKREKAKETRKLLIS